MTKIHYVRKRHTMNSNRKNKNHVYSETDLYKRFGNKDFVYYRMNDLVDLMCFNDVSGVRKFCDRHGICRYRYSKNITADENTKETIVIKSDLEKVLNIHNIGLKYFRKSGLLRKEFLSTLVNSYGQYLEELMNIPDHRDFQHIVELAECCEEFQTYIEIKLNNLLNQIVHNYPKHQIPRNINELMESYLSAVSDSPLKIAIMNNLELADFIEIIQIYRKIDFDSILEFCTDVDAKFTFPKKK